MVVSGWVESGGADDLLGLPEALQVLLGGAAVRLIGTRQVRPQTDDVDRSLILGPPQLGGQGGQLLDGGAAARHAGVDLEVETRRPPLRPGRRRQGLELGQGGDRQVQVGRQGGTQGRVLGGRSVRLHDGQEPGEEPGGLRGGLPRRAAHTGLVQKGTQGQGLGELGHPQPGGSRRQGRQSDRPQPVTVGVGLDHGHPRHARHLRQAPSVVGHGLQINDGPRGGCPGQRGPGC